MSRVLAFVVCLVAFIAAVVTLGAQEGRAQREDVTLRLERFYDNACRCYKLRFSGTIASGQANEYVAVLQQECGSASSTAIAGASTRAGGVWEAEPVAGAAPESDSSTYRARWNNRLSEALVFRGNVRLSLAELARGRYRVIVDTADTRQNMTGRIIELQRLVAGRWTRVQRAKLRGRAGAFTTTVTARGRGQSFRIAIPARSAGPCYSATTSRPFVAGRPAAPGSAAVIDRNFACSTAMRGGLRMIEISAFAGARQPPLPQTASFGLSSNWTPDATLVSASTAGLQLNPTRCAATSRRLPLTAAGLRGGAAPSQGQEYECEAPRRVFVRVRAVFRAPTKLEPDRAFGYLQLQARGEVREAALAVRTPSGRSLAFASHGAGKARVLAAPGCTEDVP
jgi:hypothetical protein